MRNLWWTLPAMGLMVLVGCVHSGGLPGQSLESIPSDSPASVELLKPDFNQPVDPVPCRRLGVSNHVSAGTAPSTQLASAVEAPEAQRISEEPVPSELLPVEDSPPPAPQPVQEERELQPSALEASLSPELAPYLGRVESLIDESWVPIVLPPLPGDFQPWWMARVAQPLRSSSRPVSVTVEGLAWRALERSPQVLAMKLDPSIRQTEILEQQAAFDWQAFVDSNMNANSDPVGNTLTTGGSPRFRDRIWAQSAGFRRRTTTGAEIEASQKIGYQNNNSRFFVPTQQGTSILTLSLTQPLLARSGRAYNTSRIAIAHLDTGVAEEELATELQDHLIQVTKGYWELYRARATLSQKQKLLARAEFVLERLQGRREVDALNRQILRARAAVASRRSEIARAVMSIQNAESQLRFLVNDPELLQGGALELLPEEPPLAFPLDISMGDSLVTAIQNRPEIAKALKTIRATSLQVGMAESEYKPQLDLVLGTYVAGLEGESDIAQSFLNQFNQGEPGWSVGLLFDLPLGRRAARARLNRRQLEMQKALLDFRTAVELSLTEVEMAVREVRTTYQEMLSTYQAMLATETEAQFLYERWHLLAGSDRSSTLLLEDLLEAQERVADEEANFVSAQVGYVMALAQLKRAMGVLLGLDDLSRLDAHPPASGFPTFSPEAPQPMNDVPAVPVPAPT